jgi:hypothetical protein
VNSFATIEDFQLFEKIGYYSLKSEDKDLMEAEDFFQRMEDIPEISDQLERFVYWMKVLGSNKGVVKGAFRHEGLIEALPPERKFTDENIELRLYCQIVSSQVVILFNGDWKTKGAKRVIDCSRVRPHHRRATNWASKLLKENIVTRQTIIVNQDEITIIY